MNKLFKFFLILFCLILIGFSTVYAVDIDMNIENDNIQNNTINESIPRNDVSNSSTNNISNSPSNTVTNAPAKTSTTTTSEDFHLSVSDIINIILISVGVVLILLGIAILIRLK